MDDRKPAQGAEDWIPDRATPVGNVGTSGALVECSSAVSSTVFTNQNKLYHILPNTLDY